MTTLKLIESAITSIEDGWTKSALETLKEAQLQEKAMNQLRAGGIFPHASAANSDNSEQQQEPAFWTRKQWGMDREFCEKPFTTDWEPLYTSPPASKPWVGLTQADALHMPYSHHWLTSNTLKDAYRLGMSDAEAKLREKNA